MHTRTHAVHLIERVCRQQMALDRVMDEHFQEQEKNLDQSFIRDCCFGVFRWYFLLDSWLEVLLEKPLRNKDSDIKHLLMLGLYQIAFQRTPDHAAVSATVDVCRDLKKSWASKLVNAVLRRFIRDHLDQLNLDLEADLKAHPSWMVDQMKHDWPEAWQDIIQANQRRAPLTVRVNQTHLNRTNLQQRWQQAGITVTPTNVSDLGLQLPGAVDIQTLPGYAEGDFSVQDQAAQLAAKILDIKAHQRVLDACAAPGGKTTHCLEECPELSELVAVDSQEARLRRLEANLERLGQAATIIHSDLTESTDWWDGNAFDRILLDVPCTASGVIRRHPDIKVHRHPPDLETIVACQKKILQNVWPLLRSGGLLVYSTCSIFKTENDLQMATFLNHQKDAQIKPIAEPWGMKTNHGRQILPGEENMDGFYYCRLIKQ